MKNIKATNEIVCSVTNGVYNFTNSVLEKNIEAILKMGPNSVPMLRLRASLIQRKINSEFLEYLNRFLRRRGRFEIKAKTVEAWLNTAMTMSFDPSVLDFFGRFLECYRCFKIHARSESFRGKGLFYEETLIQMLEKNESVVVMCDKNMGMSIFKLDTMMKADRELMKQMGGERIGLGAKDVTNRVLTEIDIFEDNLNVEEKEYLNVTYCDRSVRKCKIEVPFLRSTHKIHKMTQEAIGRKETDELKFRPVIDAKKWATRGYSELVMKMLKKFNLSVLSRGGEIIKNSQPKGGWEFVLDIQNVKVDERFCAFVNADIQEAYTNVTEDMICKAVDCLNKTFEIYSGWKVNLLLKMIHLIIRNNYVKTSCGIFLFKPVLPMGYKISGEALNTVVLVG